MILIHSWKTLTSFKSGLVKTTYAIIPLLNLSPCPLLPFLSSTHACHSSPSSSVYVSLTFTIFLFLRRPIRLISIHNTCIMVCRVLWLSLSPCLASFVMLSDSNSSFFWLWLWPYLLQVLVPSSLLHHSDPISSSSFKQNKTHLQ